MGIGENSFRELICVWSDPKFKNCQVRTCEFANVAQRTLGATKYNLFETDESKQFPYDFDWKNLDLPVDKQETA